MCGTGGESLKIAPKHFKAGATPCLPHRRKLSASPSNETYLEKRRKIKI